MRFLVDAQLPKRLAATLRRQGHDVVHTSELPAGNRTPDPSVVDAADANGRVVVTKDSDFVNSFWVLDRPRLLLLVSTGNISNDALLGLVEAQLETIVDAFAAHRFVELTAAAVIVHA